MRLGNHQNKFSGILSWRLHIHLYTLQYNYLLLKLRTFCNKEQTLQENVSLTTITARIYYLTFFGTLAALMWIRIRTYPHYWRPPCSGSRKQKSTTICQKVLKTCIKNFLNLKFGFKKIMWKVTKNKHKYHFSHENFL